MNSPMFNTKLVIPVIVISILLTTSCSILKLGQADSISLHLLEPNDKFEVIWNTLDIDVSCNKRRSNMVGLPGKIVIDGTKRDGPQSGSLIALDSLSGDVVWTSPGAGGGENLYRGIYGTAAIYSYDIQNGKVLWRTILFGGHSVVDLYFAEDKICAYTNDFEFFALDATGKIIDSFSEVDRVFLEMNGILYMDDLDAIKAIDSSSKKELCKVKLDGGYTYAPIFDNGTIYIRTGNISSSIYSIDQNTGAINWKKTKSILGNLYITDKEIYFIDYNSSLIGLDKANGREVINVKILPSLNANEFSRGYFISGDTTNNLLVLYFSDNNQIMGVQILNP